MSEDRAVTFSVDGDRALTDQYQMQCSLKVAARVLTSVAAYEVNHHGPTDSLNPASVLLPSGPSLSQMQEQKLNQQRQPEPLHDALWLLRARLGGLKDSWRWEVNIKDLLVPFCAWDGFLTNSFLVPPSTAAEK